MGHLGRERPRYIEKSLIDLAAVSLKTLLEESSNEGYLQSVLLILMPGYRLNPHLLNTTIDLPATAI